MSACCRWAAASARENSALPGPRKLARVARSSPSTIGATRHCIVEMQAASHSGMSGQSSGQQSLCMTIEDPESTLEMDAWPICARTTPIKRVSRKRRVLSIIGQLCWISDRPAIHVLLKWIIDRLHVQIADPLKLQSPQPESVCDDRD